MTTPCCELCTWNEARDTIAGRTCHRPHSVQRFSGTATLHLRKNNARRYQLALRGSQTGLLKFVIGEVDSCSVLTRHWYQVSNNVRLFGRIDNPSRTRTIKDVFRVLWLNCPALVACQQRGVADGRGLGSLQSS